MKKPPYISAIVIMIIMILTGCGEDRPDSIYNEVHLNNDEILLYSLMDDRLGIYNTKEFTWSPLYDEANTFQYVFNNDSEYIVSGNSIENGFVLLQRSPDRKSLKKVFELNNDKNCFFPLASNGRDYYYVMYVNEMSEVIEREIFTFTEDYKINSILKSNNMITAGVILNNHLYYTVYDRLTDNYDLFSMDMLDIGNGSIDLNIELQTRDIFSFQGNIYLSDYDNIYIDSITIKKEYINYIEGDYIIQFYANSQHDIVCTIKKISTGNNVGTFLRPINYEIIDNEIIIYCEAGMYIVEM